MLPEFLRALRTATTLNMMPIDPSSGGPTSWRSALPDETSGAMTLREPGPGDVDALVDLLSLSDATRFGLDEPISEASVRRLIDRITGERTAGLSFTYVVTLTPTRRVVGLVQVRQLDAAFEAAEWECTIAPSARGTGVFVETARLVCSFAFGPVGVHRLEARVEVENGRANGALRKLGAIQEGILRRSTRRGATYADQALWALLKEDWDTRAAATRPRVH